HDQVPAVGRGGAPAVVDDGGGTGLGDDRGSGDGPAGREFPPVVQGHVAPGAAGVEADGARGAGGFGGGGEGGEVGGSGDAGAPRTVRLHTGGAWRGEIGRAHG